VRYVDSTSIIRGEFMQIASSTAPNLASLLPAPGDATDRAGGTPPAVTTNRSTQLPVADAPDVNNAADDLWNTVTLSSDATRRLDNLVAPAIYAEIWKGNIKVAQIDAHGGVTSFVGRIAGMAGASGGGGAIMASLRAAQIAQAVGGEIRVAGQITGGAALALRARVEQFYGQSA
jgi:hypothetical protein